MDSFFNCVAILMSNNLRSLLNRSLEDLVSFFEMYKDGNGFEGVFKRCLPIIQQLIIVNVVPDYEEETISFSPSFFDIEISMNEIINAIVLSVNNLTRVESLLFYQADNNPTKTIPSTDLSDQFVLMVKEKVSSIIVVNTDGPHG